MIGKKISELAAEGKLSAQPDYIYGVLAGASVAVIGPKKSIAVPLTGTTVIMIANQRWLSVAPAGTLAVLTITLPPSPADGQLCSIGFCQAITALTVNGGTGGALVVGVGAAGSPAAINSGLTLVYQASNNTWSRSG